MNVAAILKQKGRAVTTAAVGDSVRTAAQLLASNRIGAVVVIDAVGKVVGILSERDIIRELAEQGPVCLDTSIAGVMTRAVVTCDEADTLDQLMALMTARRFRHLPVVTKGQLAGIISIGDVVKRHIADVEMEATAMREYIATH